MLIQDFFQILTNEFKSIKDIVVPGVPSIVGYNDFGKKVVNKYLYSKYLESKVGGSFSEFNDSFNEFKIIKDDVNFNVRVGGFFVYALIECNLLKLEIDTKPSIGLQGFKVL